MAPRKLPRGGLRRLLQWWAALLRISDWDYTLKREFVEGWPETQGWCTPLVHGKEAVVCIDPRVQDVELILVHELVHIAHSPLIKSRVQSIPEENAVWAMAKALVALKRKAYGEDTAA